MNNWVEWYNQGFRAGRLDAALGATSSYAIQSTQDSEYNRAFREGYKAGLRDKDKECGERNDHRKDY